MGRNDDTLTPEDRVLDEIEALVKSRLKPGVKVISESFYRSWPKDRCGFVELREHDAPHQKGITHEPGIPMAALVPEKILPIAKWIVRQIGKVHPEWFRPDEEE